MIRSVLAVVFLYGISIPAYAGEDAQKSHKLSITLSPFHLLNPELHLTCEFRLTPKMSVAATLAAGKFTDEDKSYNIGEAAGQFRYYLLGSFTHGMMLAADAGYVGVNEPLDNSMAYLVGARAGAVLGYKIALKSGFTAEAQIGPVYVRESAGHSELQTLINLKLGWSL